MIILINKKINKKINKINNINNINFIKMLQEEYDMILDAIDNEETANILPLFKKYSLEPKSKLFDYPRIDDNNNNELHTYLDYVISYNLTNVLDIFIDDLNLVIDDKVISQTLILQNLDTYRYICDLGYIPQGETLRIAVKFCYCDVALDILECDKDLITYIKDIDLFYLFSYNICEDLVEFIRLLFNYGIDAKLFSNFLAILKEQKYENDKLNGNMVDDEHYIILELIYVLENNGVIPEEL